MSSPAENKKQVSGLNAGQWQDAIVDQICERIFVAMGAGNVQAAFDYFDVDGDGNIEYEEFINALKSLEIGLSDDQACVCFVCVVGACVCARGSYTLFLTQTVPTGCPVCHVLSMSGSTMGAVCVCVAREKKIRVRMCIVLRFASHEA